METRINKYLSQSGYCSRRQADKLIEEKRVTIDGKIAVMGDKVSDLQKVCVDGSIIDNNEKEVLLAFYKPVGIVCTTTDKQGDNNIVDYIGYEQRIYPVGRLDKDSEGLILMTNNGEITDKILRAANGHEKEYIVKVDKKINEDFIRKMSEGVYIKELDVTTRKCFVQKQSDKAFRIILTQGLNRQIRRMCETLGYKVTHLKRIRIMNILLGDLKEGEYRELEKEEYNKLIKDLYKE
ncbi:MAG: pseudouridine synthase [Lachnospira sp.]|nr:pseudouridine synthase [Lachnospira sp.]